MRTSILIPMHVAVAVHSQATDHLGGSEHSLLTLLDTWRSRDAHLRVTLISPTAHSALALRARERGFAVKTFPYEGWILPRPRGGAAEVLMRRTRDARAVEGIATFLTDADVSLVVTNTLIAPWGAFAAALAGVPHVWFARESLVHMEDVTTLFSVDTTLRLVGELSHVVVANSQNLASELTPFSGDAKVTWCYPHINVETIRQAAKLRPIPDDVDSRDGVVHIVVAGRIARTKGQWRVIEALPYLQRRGVPYEVTFVGQEVEGGATEALMARARRLGVAQQIRFIGERENPHPYVAQADIAVIPSDWETFGRATAEAMVLGRAVVASDCGATSVLVDHRESGMLFDRNLPHELGAALVELADNRTLRERLGEAAALRAAALEKNSDSRHAIDILAEAARAQPAPVPPVITEWLAARRLSDPRLHTFIAQSARLRQIFRRLIRIAHDPVGAMRRRLSRSVRPFRRPLNKSSS